MEVECRKVVSFTMVQTSWVCGGFNEECVCTPYRLKLKRAVDKTMELCRERASNDATFYVLEK